MPHTFPLAYIFGAMIAVFLSHPLSPSDYLLVIGTLAFAISSARAGRMKILRETNIDLKERNNQLETATTHMLSEARVREAQIAELLKRPTLDTQERMLEMLLDKLQQRDALFTEILAELRVIHTAVVPPS